MYRWMWVTAVIGAVSFAPACETQEPEENSIVGDPRLLPGIGWDGGARDRVLVEPDASSRDLNTALPDRVSQIDSSAPDLAPADHEQVDTIPAPDSAVPDSAVPDSAVPDSAVPDSVVPDSVVPDSAVPDSAVPDSAVPDSIVPDSTSPDLIVHDCDLDQDCDDQNACNGVETCTPNDQGKRVCGAGQALECVPSDPCHTSTCDVATGCVEVLIDGDEDGHAPETLGLCGTDCDDLRNDVHPGAEELCDEVDHDCDDSPVPVDPPLWYKDCDKDGFALEDAQTLASCADPGNIIDCGWTRLAPEDGVSIDCRDNNSSMYPGQAEFFELPHDSEASGDNARFGDYDCDGVATYNLARISGVSTTEPCDFNVTGSGDQYQVSCDGAQGWTGRMVQSCGGTANYTSCREPHECLLAADRCEAAGYTAVCLGASAAEEDPCYCPSPCLPSCTPGEPGCPWIYVRCDRNTNSATMGCR